MSSLQGIELCLKTTEALSESRSDAGRAYDPTNDPTNDPTSTCNRHEALVSATLRAVSGRVSTAPETKAFELMACLPCVRGSRLEVEHVKEVVECLTQSGMNAAVFHSASLRPRAWMLHDSQPLPGNFAHR